MLAHDWYLQLENDKTLDKLITETWSSSFNQNLHYFEPIRRITPVFNTSNGRCIGQVASPHQLLQINQIQPVKKLAFYQRAPGLTRGVGFPIPPGFSSVSNSNFLISEDIGADSSLKLDSLKDSNAQGQSGTPISFSNSITEEIDSIVRDVTLKKNENLAFQSKWYDVLDANTVPSDWNQLLARGLAFDFPFILDTFQQQAISMLEKGECIFVAAHTSAGKTVVAEYAIALANRRHLTRAIYTSPIKALSNQKYRDFRRTFGDGPENVGLLTGDVQINPDAGCLIMTTEILRSMLYRGADTISDVEFVIFDEVHYVSDASRGVVWEEVLIMLPPQITVVMLSATTPNTTEFAEWVGRMRARTVHVITTPKRPVPLQHYLFMEGVTAPKIKSSDSGILTTTESTMVKPKGVSADTVKSSNIKYSTVGDNEKCIKNKVQLGPPLFQIVNSSRDFSPFEYKNAVAERKKNNPFATRAYAGKSATWTSLVSLLRRKELLPAVIFTFSRRLCEQNADSLGSVDLLDAVEKSSVHSFLERSIRRLAKEDRQLPQIARTREMLRRGIAVHHSGLLPILREAVEVLFGRGLVRVLFATETFAMGVNMPARTVAFASLRKHDGTEFRALSPGEYTQMAGRAGRRGLDANGIVIIVVPASSCSEDVPSEINLRSIILGSPAPLVSRFRLTYTMVLSLLRIRALTVEEVLRRSFAEAFGAKMRPNDENELKNARDRYESLPEVDCRRCVDILPAIHSASRRIQKDSAFLFERLGNSLSSLFCKGRVLVIQLGVENAVAVVLLENLLDHGLLVLRFYQSNHQYVSNVKVNDESRPIQYLQSVLFVEFPNFQSGTLDREIFLIPRNRVLLVLRKPLRLPESNLKLPSYLNGPKNVSNLDNHENTSFLDSIQDAFVGAFSDSTRISFSDLEPIPMAKKDIDLEEARLRREKDLENIFSLVPDGSKHCLDLKAHLTSYHEKVCSLETCKELTLRLSDSQLALLPEYRGFLSILQILGFVDGTNVLVKGRVACEMNTVHAVLVTELLFENAFASSSPAATVALLSAMVFQERTSSHSESDSSDHGVALFTSTLDLLNQYPELAEPVEKMRETALRIDMIQRSAFNVDGKSMSKNDNDSLRLNFDLVPVVYEWARGKSFLKIADIAPVPEGTVVRCIVRLEETCREIRTAAKIMGNVFLFRKMEDASRLIKRDICFAASLYI